MKRIYRTSFCFFLILTALSCSSSISNQPLPDLSKAKDFAVEKSNLGIDRVNDKFIIKPEAKSKLRNESRKNDRVTIVSTDGYKWTVEERAQTAMKAAVEILKQLELDAVIVDLRVYLPPPSKERYEPLASATYSPDGKGFSGSDTKVWDVLASDYKSSDEEMQISSYWKAHRDQFDKGKGLDEKALKEFLIKKYSLKKNINDSFLPTFVLTPYQVK